MGGCVVDLLVTRFDRSDLAIVTGFGLCSIVGGKVSIWSPCVEVKMEKFVWASGGGFCFDSGRLVIAGSQSFGGLGLLSVARSIPVGFIAFGS